MGEVEKLLKKIIKKTGDDQAKYMFGVEYSSDTDPDYKAMIKFSKDGVPPFLAGAGSEVELIERLKDYIKNGDIKKVAVMYCEAQILLEKKAIEFHESLIEQYENPSTELRTK